MAGHIIEKTISFVKEQLAGAEGGHDWFHTERVWKMARFLRDREGRGDHLTIELAALLHDISDPKFNDGDEQKAGRLAYRFLIENKVGRDRAEHIRSIINHLSFKGGIPQEEIDSIEFGIVQDADRLDAMGAIGIARAFHYGGYKDRVIFDPGIPIRDYPDSSAYHASDAPTINHFYEKLLKLKDLMNTSAGKKIARERHDFMVRFLERFFRETDQEGPGPKRENSG
ncbi:MAG: HD domain-containing protein [Bacteroidales bacterium]